MIRWNATPAFSSRRGRDWAYKLSVKCRVYNEVALDCDARSLRRAGCGVYYNTTCTIVARSENIYARAPHRACAGACRRPRGALRAARVAKQRLNRPHSTKTQCDASSGPCARLSTSQRVALRSRYALPPLRPATQQKPPRAAHGSNGGSRPRATQIALPRNGMYGPPALATTLP